ncbi:MAG: amidohydrolase family protein [Alphaproteobacteria bacterium]|nr:amidohydrolase family protein [Alphaproteobacteria bacterium]
MIRLLDTHQHLIYPQTAGYAWTDAIPALAHTAFTLKDYTDLTVGKGIGATIFMEAGVDDADYRAETRYIATLANDPATAMVGMIASCRPETDQGFDAWLEECDGLPVVGFRRILHEIDDDVSQSATFRANVTKIGRGNFAFDMCFLARQLPVAADLARSCPDTALVLDHCGVPDIAGGDDEQWRKDISTLAALPNVTCKLSGIMAYCPPGTATLANVRPWLDHVVESFGTDRVIWGSDWPVVNLANGIGDWIDVTGKYLAQFSTTEAEKIGFANAAALYGVKFPGDD